jgi:N-acetylgalactosamine kinase
MPSPEEQRLLERAHDVLPAPPRCIVRVPGRVDLLGSHTDYNDLPVLACALSLAIYGAACPTARPEIRADNLDPGYPSAQFAINQPIQPGDSGHWENYLKAGVKGAIEHHQLDPALTAGWQCLFHSSLPAGAGLSSSSALVIAAAMLTEAFNGLDTSPAERAGYLPAAEHFVGTQGGALDHTTILQSEPGKILHIDFSPLQTRSIDFPDEAALAIVHSGQQAEKSAAARSAYNLRVMECRLATLFLARTLDPSIDPTDLLHHPTTPGRILRSRGLPALQTAAIAAEAVPPAISSTSEFASGLGVSLAAVESSPIFPTGPQAISMPPDGFQLRKRIVHVLGEAARVEQAALAFQSGRLDEAGSLMTQSYQSAKELYEISTPALDQLIAAGLDAGALGGRIAGAGFGGCAVFLLRKGQLSEWKKQVSANAPKAGPFWEAHPSAPAHIQ